jgi:DNA (cytosine-5)-methyltransferase 1
MSSPTERKSTGATASRASTLLAPGLTAEHIAEIEAALAAADSDWRPTGCRTGITFTDVFCGFGGSSIGLENAGLELLLGANHRDKAIATHALNFPDADHLIADVSNYDMRRLPASDVLWASPICTELSPAALDRTRATFWDVVRATEAQRYKIVAIENVVEASEWELFDIWLAAMDKLGYNHQFISVSSAHIGDDTNPHAPQWRDRLYIRVHRAVPADARCPSAPAGVVPAVRRGQPGRPIMEAPGSPQDW